MSASFFFFLCLPPSSYLDPQVILCASGDDLSLSGEGIGSTFHLKKNHPPSLQPTHLLLSSPRGEWPRRVFLYLRQAEIILPVFIIQTLASLLWRMGKAGIEKKSLVD